MKKKSSSTSHKMGKVHVPLSKCDFAKQKKIVALASFPVERKYGVLTLGRLKLYHLALNHGRNHITLTE